jgi:hypothetical protein
VKLELVELLQQELNSLILVSDFVPWVGAKRLNLAQISGKFRSGFAFFGRSREVEAADAAWSLGWETVSSRCAGPFTDAVLVVRCDQKSVRAITKNRTIRT